MRISTKDLARACEKAAHLLDEFSGDASKVCLVVRNPAFSDGYLIATDDDLKEVLAVLQKATSKPLYGEFFPFDKEEH